MPLMLTLLTMFGLAHPIHSSAAVLEMDATGRVAHLRLRVFADDFPPGEDRQAITVYLRTRFTLTDRTGAEAQFTLHRVRTDGPVLVLELTAQTPRGVAGARVWHGVLAERFADQVNIVQARYAGRSALLLFTASDRAKSLP